MTQLLELEMGFLKFKEEKILFFPLALQGIPVDVTVEISAANINSVTDGGYLRYTVEGGNIRNEILINKSLGIYKPRFDFGVIHSGSRLLNTVSTLIFKNVPFGSTINIFISNGASNHKHVLDIK